jgi:hypothetical protein
MPDRFGVPVVTCLRAFLCCTQGCGCVRASGIPCALVFFKGDNDNDDAKPGRIHAAGMLRCGYTFVAAHPSRRGLMAAPQDEV